MEQLAGFRLRTDAYPTQRRPSQRKTRLCVFLLQRGNKYVCNSDQISVLTPLDDTVGRLTWWSPQQRDLPWDLRSSVSYAE
jgi:hypothetical protein